MFFSIPKPCTLNPIVLTLNLMYPILCQALCEAQAAIRDGVLSYWAQYGQGFGAGGLGFRVRGLEFRVLV